MSTPSDPGSGQRDQPGRRDQPGPAGGPAPDVPTCYRHPGRETYVSCVRCGRPACPDCMRAASVGQQCVDCVNESARGSRQARTTFGGRPAAGAVVTWTLVAINVAVFLGTWIHPGIVNDLAMLGKAPYTYGGPAHGVAAGEWYRLITSAFLAPATGLSGGLGILDIVFNMWALIFVGPALEHLLGRLRFLSVYLLSAVGGSVMYYFIAAPNVPAVGASGAIFGLFGAWFIAYRRLRLDTRGIGVLIAINLALPFFIHFIAWQDHIGGLLTGTVLTAAYAYAPRKNRTLLQVVATAAIIVLLVVAIVVRTRQLTALGL